MYRVSSPPETPMTPVGPPRRGFWKLLCCVSLHLYRSDVRWDAAGPHGPERDYECRKCGATWTF